MVIIVLVHIFFINQLRNSGKLVQERLSLQSHSDQISKVFANNLFGECNLFEDHELMAHVKSSLSKHSLDFHLVQKPIVEINKLSFKEIIFRVFKLKRSDIFYETRGYLVEHKESSKCFGIL